ncbi:hypothetical protein F4782DRAFT_511049 [Xylaria castorea]|nr:hypothetical protein F4782DRAFT_511049 [Xylaria castorea]
MAGKIKYNEAATLLTLPQNIRQLIYGYAGLPVKDFIYLVPREEVLPSRKSQDSNIIRSVPPEFSLASVDARQEWLDGSKPPRIEGWGGAWALLLSCKLINSEVHSFLYVNNSIVVCDEHVEYGLNLLRYMSPEHCRNLRDLYVQLQFKETPKSKKNDMSQPRTFLPISTEKIRRWHDAAQHILSHASPGALSLHLVCGTHEEVLIHDTLRPLLATAGTLKACDLRFSSRSCYRLSSLARESVLRIEGRSVELEFCKKPFRFFDLPPEIRIAILKYTDLVTPGCQISWKMMLGFRIHYRKADHRRLSLLNDIPWAQKLLHSNQFRLCATKTENHKFTDFCICVGSAYSARCKCWSPPSSLMLVSREFYAHAIHTLYSCNRIILPSNPRCLNFTRFTMRHVQTQCFQHLRTIEIVLPKIWKTIDSMTDHSFYLDWVAAIERLKAHANLPALTLIVCAPLVNPDDVFPPLEEAKEHVSEMLKEPQLERYYKFLIPLGTLSGLKRLFIHFEWGWHWSPDNNESVKWLYNGNNSWLAIEYLSSDHKLVAQWEVVFERLIMGGDYDSMAVGKAEEIPSEWMIAHFCTFNNQLAYILG